MKILHFSFVGGGRCGGPDQKPEPIGGFYFIFFPPHIHAFKLFGTQKPSEGQVPTHKIRRKNQDQGLFNFTLRGSFITCTFWHV